MGHKVNPISMRLQVNKNWRSRWFANKRDYPTFLDQDLRVRRFFDKTFRGSGVIDRVEIERSPNLATITVYTAKAASNCLKLRSKRYSAQPLDSILKKSKNRNYMQS